jgi:hypothetical protein
MGADLGDNIDVAQDVSLLSCNECLERYFYL